MRKTKFVIVGIINTGVDFVVFNLLTTITNVNPILSNVLSFSCGIVCSYLLNRNWTFSDVATNAKFSEFGKFVTSNLLSLLLNTLVVWFAILFIDSNFAFESWQESAIAKMVATLFSLVLNYTLFSRWVFVNKTN